MPCHRCGARQTDPVRGASPWRRGVRRGEQVLVCPDCQRGRDWTADLARCGACGSSRLVRVLGRTECKDCGAEDSVVEAGGSEAGSGAAAGGRSDAATRVASEAVGSSGPDTGSDTSVPGSSDAARLSAEVQAALERQRRG
jgi:hypothetical protein